MDKENESFQRQALEVRQPDENFDPTIEPQDGEEYLMQVIYERNHCPSVVVKPPEQHKIQKTNLPEVYKSEKHNINDTSSMSLRPSPEWKSTQIQDFENLRKQILDYRSELNTNGFTEENKIPLTDDSELWEEFCRTNDPILSTMLRINQRSLERLLEYLSEWLKVETDGEMINLLLDQDLWLGKWIYSILICLRIPLEGDVLSSVRDIGKTCICLRNCLKDNDIMKAAPYNLFLTIISKVFGQLDLMEFV